MSEVNFPPKEISNPTALGKRNFEEIILWMLVNNEECQWSDFTEEPLNFSTSTLSKYFNLLKSKGYVDNYQRGLYKITPEGRKRFDQISTLKNKIRKLNTPPEVIKRQRNYDDWILWMVYNNSYCRWSDFLEPPLSINQSSLSKNLNILLEKNYVQKEGKQYKITESGKIQYSIMLKNYDLDRQSILDEESKRIDEITKDVIKFFKEHNVEDENVQYRFLNNILKLDYTKVSSTLTDQSDFEKILLFLSINHPDRYPTYISHEEFAKSYGISENTLRYYVDDVILGNEKYPIKFFKLKVSQNKYYYFQENERLELILRATTEEYITKSTYLNRLYSRSIDPSTLQNTILIDACGSVLNPELKEAFKQFLPEYINYLAYKVKEKVEFKESYDKLAAVIWENVIDLFESRNPKDLQYQFMGQNEINYKLDLLILGLLTPYYSSKEDPAIKIIQHLITKKEFGNALEAIESTISTNQENLNLILLKGLLLCYLNRNNDALQYLTTKIRLPKEKKMDQLYSIAYFLLIFSNLTIGNFTVALDYLNKMKVAFSTHPLFYATKGLVLGFNIMYNFEKLDSSIENGLNDLDSAIDLDSHKSNKALYYYLKSKILLKLGSYEESILAIDEAINLSPKNIELYSMKNSILVYYNQYDDVLILLDLMLKKFPEMEKDIKLKKAIVYKQLGDLKTGFKIIEDLLERSPEDGNILNCKAYWYLYLNKKEEAIQLIEKIVKKEPNNGIYYDTYGEILMYYGEYEKAILQFQRAIKNSKFGYLIHEIYIKLGICYKELSNYEKAIENLKIGKEFTRKCLCDNETKQKWFTIAELFTSELE